MFERHENHVMLLCRLRNFKVPRELSLDVIELSRTSASDESKTLFEQVKYRYGCIELQFIVA